MQENEIENTKLYGKFKKWKKTLFFVVLKLNLGVYWLQKKKKIKLTRLPLFVAQPELIRNFVSVE